jgi:long-chain fatty acid transport protein
MKDFSMTFTADNAATNGGFAGQVLNATLFQDWSDQTIVQLGAARRITDRLTLRAGANFTSDPIPAKYLNCLFPATVEKHLTAGFGWKIDERSSFDASLTYGFESEQTNGYGIRIGHSQLNTQLLYSYRF